MRHYDRVSFRHLNDSERYRDYEYLADDGWVGPNELVPHGAMDENEAPWSTLHGYETGPFLPERTFDARRGQGREYGRDLGLGYGRDANRPRHFERTERDDWDLRHREREAPSGLRARGEAVRGAATSAIRDVGDIVRHPGSFVGRMVRGLFHGKGPKNWMRSDTRIHDEVCELLAHHPEIDASEIEVVVKDGEITLEGTVGDRRTKRLAEEVLDDVMGVHDVHNRLRVAGGRSAESTMTDGNGARQLTGSQGVQSTTAAVRR